MQIKTYPGNEQKVEEVKQEIEAQLEEAIEAEPDELSDADLQSVAGGTSVATCEP